MPARRHILRSQARDWPGALIGLLALCELGWHGHSLLQVAPAEQFVGVDPVSEALQRLEADSQSGGPLRIKARDNFYGDLPAVCHGIEKTNVNDVFQIDHAARLYESSIPSRRVDAAERFDLMNRAGRGLLPRGPTVGLRPDECFPRRLRPI